MRILVTGSTGLIGEAVAAHLARQGHEVFGLSRK
ncbi:MAG TPA: NAD-dependent epimerase/dehydratase family protein, partial [Candidatus Hydrogenedentes bacterium]|nr:NAD-dependent epimerase/dehydratase family protein [Candidatus Hydrogenedentota bacterium]